MNLPTLNSTLTKTNGSFLYIKTIRHLHESEGPNLVRFLPLPVKEVSRYADLHTYIQMVALESESNSKQPAHHHNYYCRDCLSKTEAPLAPTDTRGL